MAATVRLIQWNEAEAADRARILRGFGYEVDAAPLDPAGLRRLRQHPPAVIVIDLTRRHTQGRDVAMAMRGTAATRHVPLVFAGGDPDEVAEVNELLPDAFYTGWDRIGLVVARALTHPPANPVIPGTAMRAYRDTPLFINLGIAAGMKVAVLSAPDDFADALGPLPDDVTFRTSARGRSDLTIWFVRRRSELNRRIEALAKRAAYGPLWICWPKPTSELDTDLSQILVREAGLGHGLVDDKIVAVGEDWSALRFVPRRRR